MTSNLWIVIPAAGESKRFQEAGHLTPKPFLKIQDKTGLTMRMIIHVVSSLPPMSKEAFDRIIIGYPYGYEVKHDPRLSIYTKLREIKHTTGQADTVHQLIKDLPADDRVMVLDCDMILTTPDLRIIMEFCASWDQVVAVAETFDPNASRVDQIQFPTRFVEKQPISIYGIMGARSFKNIGLLRRALDMALRETTTEPYLSTAMNYYPGRAWAHLITEYIDWGTPERIRESGAQIV